MDYYKQEFVDFLLESNALKFGDFTLKSGRKSPFFMNMGELNDGEQLKKLGMAYAEAINDNFGRDIDVVFGPAYKGIPLAAATAIQFHELFNKPVRFTSNRKEVKDHGDTGILLGSKLKDGDRVVIIEDVTTSGKSIEEVMPIIMTQADVEIVGEVVSLDRMEYGSDKTKTALEEVSEKYGIKTTAIVSMRDVCEVLKSRKESLTSTIQSIRKYYEQYGPEGRKNIV
ncbi:orotate phosphoribosyltransferase [Candidatus Saccharibacteria bacterium]|nr:orotate phosphoribosyltransferase [Candidatus Saccharibacteria bacterium]MBQ2639075.1 orotate phosphoribosyltransferase [Candidatus Saccharibacteria bacterium]